MLDIPALIADTKTKLSAEWSVELAVSMNPFDANDYPDKQPLCMFFQGDESPTPRYGSPVSQELHSAIEALILCKHDELDQRVKQVRDVVYNWEKPGDNLHLGLYLAESGKHGIREIKGDYVFWADTWETKYST